MKNFTSPSSIGAIALVGLLSIGTAGAAVIIEPNGKASGNFSASTDATDSDLAGGGTLAAPGLTLDAASVRGGEAYTYTYVPASLADNTTFITGAFLNSRAGLFASGHLGGEAGIYNVYHVFPLTTNASGQPTLYDIQVNSISVATSSQDQNVNDTTTLQLDGVGIGHWELIGQATVLNKSDTITVTVDATTPNQWTGVRTAGVLFDYVGPVPEPSSALLLGLGAFALLGRRRR